MHRLYYHRDSKRSAEATYDWLVDEVRELGEALNSGDKNAIENESADVIAWLASLANVADINLEKSALAKYYGKCPKCSKSPCKCRFRMRPTSASAPRL